MHRTGYLSIFWQAAFFLLIAGLGRFSASAICLPAPAGLVDFWPGEGNANDLLGNYNGTLLNGTSFAPGRVGNAFSFDGTNDLVLINAPALTLPWTAEFWVNRQPSPEDSAVLLSDTNAALKLEQYPNTKQVGITRWRVQDYSFNYTMPIGVWTHLVFVGTANNTALYTNGSLQGNLAVGISLPRTTMGRDITNRFVKALKGLVDEPSLYNRALTAPEILALFNAGSDGKCVPLNCPNNDGFACRQIITGSNISIPISNLGATREPGEPLHGGISCSNSLWYSWTAPASGGVVVEATGGFDFASPILAVYTGSNLASLTNVAFNFAPFSGSGSPLSKARAVFTAVQGQVYQIVVDGVPTEFFESQGDLAFTLTFSPPPANDLFQNATLITGIFYEKTNGTFIGANREASEPAHGTSYAQTLWWNWTAPTNLNVSAIPIRLTADAVSFPPFFGVYTGGTVGALTPVTISQSADGMTQTATFSAIPGTAYRIALAGFQNDTNTILPLFGNVRFRLNTRALALSIQNLSSTTPPPPALTFTATARVENLGSAPSRPMRVRTTAVPGISMRGGFISGIENTNIAQGNWLLPSLAPGQNTNLPIAGITPAPTEVQPGISSAEGYGVYAELQEQTDASSWATIDQALVLYGTWPNLNGLPGPGGGVIRLDPDYLGLSSFNPLQSVIAVGPATVTEGMSGNYWGKAIFNDATIVNFTNTAWTASRFTIATNGLFTSGNVTSNSVVTLSAPYSSQGLVHNATTNVTVINLPPPSLANLGLLGNTGIVFTLSGVPGRSNVIEATTNLAASGVWLPLATNAPASGLSSFTNYSRTNFPQRFYRAREQ